MALKLDSRQTCQRSKLDQLSTTTDLRLDAIMNLINDELTMPLRMRANLGAGTDGTPNQNLYIDSIFVKTLDTGAADSGHERSRTIPPISGVLPSYSGGGYITFPTASGGSITGTGLTLNTTYTLTLASGQYVKILVWLNASNQFGMEIGAAAVSEAAAVLPVPPTDAFALGYIVMTNTAGTISKVLNENIYQFVGGGGSGGGSGASKEITQPNSFVVGNVVYYDGSSYVLAQANTGGAAEAIGIVSKASSTKFTLTELGYVSSIDVANVNVTGGNLTPGEVYFLSDASAGKLVVSEPTTIGSVSKPMLIADSTNSGYVLNYRGVVVGGANARTQISLTNNSTTAVQLVAPTYDAGEMVGWVSLQNSTAANSKRFYIQIQFAKNGPGTDYNVAYQTSGDTPPSGFSVSYSSSYVRMTLPNISGLTSASFNYALNAPAVGTNFPLSIDASSIASGIVSASNLPVAGAAASGIVSTGSQTFAGEKIFTGGIAIPAGSLEVGKDRASDGNAFLDFTSQSGAVDYNARIIRGSGANGELVIDQTGTGGIKVNGTMRFNSSTGVGLYFVQTTVVNLGSGGITDIPAPSGWTNGHAIVQNGDYPTNPFIVSGTVPVANAVRVYHTGGTAGAACRMNVIWTKG